MTLTVEDADRGTLVETDTKRTWPRAVADVARSQFRDDGPGTVWAGLGLVAAGFVLIAVTWYVVSGESLVYKQLPYVVSGGITALGLIIVGVLAVSIATRRRDTALRAAQDARVLALLEALDRHNEAEIPPEKSRRAPATRKSSA